ncbi:MAG: hypothetical protein AB8G23_20065 [Myxococcota bacterium]
MSKQNQWLASMIAFGVILLGIGFSSGPAQAEAGDALDARLEGALGEYAAALRETDRDARLAGFSRAEQGFAAVVREGVETPALFTNWGNAAFQAAHPGVAVLAYRRALALDSNAAVPRQNLAHFRSLLPGWVPTPSEAEGAESLLFYRVIPAPLRASFASGFFALGAMGFALAIRRKESAWRGLGYLAWIVWGLLLASVFFDRDEEGRDFAVVMMAETPARSADSALAPLSLPDPLPAGVEVERLERRAEWSRVRLANGRDVWVRNSALTSVDPALES